MKANSSRISLRANLSQVCHLMRLRDIYEKHQARPFYAHVTTTSNKNEPFRTLKENIPVQREVANEHMNTTAELSKRTFQALTFSA